MIVLSDNDIVLKLAGCNLLEKFFEILEVDLDNVLITNMAYYAIPKQAKKKLVDDNAKQRLGQFLKSVGKIPLVDSDLLYQLQDFDNMDGGESRLMLAASQNPNAYLATGDKRCLKSLVDNQLSEPLDQVFNSLKQRVYCLETAFMLLIENMGFEKVNDMVINRCVDDGVLRMAFGPERGIEHATECLKSYCQYLSPLLVPMSCLKTSLA